MAVNRFDKPVESQYISQYVPIPFEQLYKIGKEYNDRVDQAIQDIADYNKEWKSFDSPIKKDVEDYYRIAMNPQIKSLIDSAVSNPDNLKTFDFKRQLQNAINSVDYSSLNKLKSSATNAYNYINAAKELAKKGQYNKNWDLVDFNKYSTLESGKVFDEVSPIQYQSLQSIIDPYVRNIEETFYRGVDPNSGQRIPYTNWMAVTENDIRDIINSRYNDIISTPQGRMWFRDIANNVLSVNPNATSVDIDNAFSRALVDASRQYIHSKPIQDRLGFEMWKYNQEHPEQTPNSNKSLTQKIEERGRDLYSNMQGMLFNMILKPEDLQTVNRLEEQYISAEKNKDSAKMKEIAKQYKDITRKYGLKDYINAIVTSGAKDGYVTGKQLRNNINFAAESLIMPYVGDREVQTALQAMPNSFKNDSDFGLGITVSNIGDYDLLSDLILRMSGNNYTANSPTKYVSDYIKRNRIPSEVIGLRGSISIASGNMNTTQQAIKREYLLPMVKDNDGNPYDPNETSPRKLKEYYDNLDKLMRNAGFTKVTSQQLERTNKKQDFNEGNPEGKNKGTITRTYKGGDVYYSTDFVNSLPTTGQSGSDDFNNFYDQLSLSRSQAGEMYNVRQKQQQNADFDDEYYQ